MIIFLFYSLLSCSLFDGFAVESSKTVNVKMTEQYNTLVVVDIAAKTRSFDLKMAVWRVAKKRLKC